MRKRHAGRVQDIGKIIAVLTKRPEPPMGSYEGTSQPKPRDFGAPHNPRIPDPGQLQGLGPLPRALLRGRRDTVGLVPCGVLVSRAPEGCRPTWAWRARHGVSLLELGMSDCCVPTLLTLPCTMVPGRVVAGRGGKVLSGRWTLHDPHLHARTEHRPSASGVPGHGQAKVLKAACDRRGIESPTIFNHLYSYRVGFNSERITNRGNLMMYTGSCQTKSQALASEEEYSYGDIACLSELIVLLRL